MIELVEGRRVMLIRQEEFEVDVEVTGGSACLLRRQQTASKLVCWAR
jgi:hypothetical protein